MATDFEAEGLLEGTEGAGREARLRLLEELSDDGVSLDELRNAVAQDRLVLLPVERVLEGEGERYTRAEVAEHAGISTDFLVRLWRALGMTEQEEDRRVFTDRDVEAAKRVKALLDLGIPEAELLEVTRVMALSMSQLAAASRTLGARALRKPDDTEYDVANRFAAVQSGLPPLLAPTLEYVLELHMREQIRHDVFGDTEIATGMEGGVEIAVAFADLVDFTKLGERLHPDELGALSDRLSELASGVARGPVRLVKLIGDAVMLTSNDADALVNATLDLVAASEQQGEGFPLLRGGAAFGRALPRGGDYYGRPVNLASRITGIARPGSVLCDEALHDAIGENGYDWSFAGGRRLKGIKSEIKVFRARPAGSGETD